MVDDVLPETFGVLVFCSLIGLFAGGVRAARRPELANPIRDVLGQSGASALASFITAAALLEFWPQRHIHLIIALSALAGWGGAMLLDVLLDSGMAWLKARLAKLTPQAGNKPPEAGDQP